MAPLLRMKYGQIAPNKSINVMIYRCFEYLSERTQRTFVRKFHEQPHDEDQVLHTFRELIVGAYMASKGLDLSHEPAIDGKSPDWLILDENGDYRCIVEVATFHINRRTESAMNRVLEAGGTWSGVIDSHSKRLWHAVNRKASKYERLVGLHGYGFVVSLFGHFFAGVEPDEVRAVLDGPEGSIFLDCPHLSGILFFTENSGPYWFTYIENPHALRPMELPSGAF